MVTLIAAFSIGLVLTQFGDFLQKVGVDPPLPLNDEMLVNTVVHTNEQMVSTRLFGRYFLDYFAGRVRAFADRDENIHQTLTRLDPQEMLELSRIPSGINDEQARQIACEVFERLGFHDADFEPPLVRHFTYQPNEYDPQRLKLPYSHVRWDLKGAHRGDMLDPCVVMIVSGRTERLIFYDISSLARFGR
jgi:hypothetical protein